jgi:RNA polymerase sigma-70 factor, ECF subfamily
MLTRDPLAHPEPLIHRVYAYVAYRIGEGADAEDVTSETFERALRYRESYDAAKGPPVAWLIGIAQRIIAARGQVLEIPMADVPKEADQGALADDVVPRLVVRSAVAALGERDRELIALRYGADMTVRQIGELLGLRTNSVEVALHRARGRLAAVLAGEDEPRAAVESTIVTAPETAKAEKKTGTDARPRAGS